MMYLVKESSDELTVAANCATLSEIRLLLLEILLRPPVLLGKRPLAIHVVILEDSSVTSCILRNLPQLLYSVLTANTSGDIADNSVESTLGSLDSRSSEHCMVGWGEKIFCSAQNSFRGATIKPARFGHRLK